MEEMKVDFETFKEEIRGDIHRRERLAEQDKQIAEQKEEIAELKKQKQ